MLNVVQHEIVPNPPYPLLSRSPVFAAPHGKLAITGDFSKILWYEWLST